MLYIFFTDNTLFLNNLLMVIHETYTNNFTFWAVSAWQPIESRFSPEDFDQLCGKILRLSPRNPCLLKLSSFFPLFSASQAVVYIVSLKKKKKTPPLDFLLIRFLTGGCHLGPAVLLTSRVCFVPGNYECQIWITHPILYMPAPQ